MPFDEYDEKDEIIIQTGGEMSTGAKWAIGLGAPWFSAWDQSTFGTH